MKIQIKRVYDKIERNDGYRILVDRVWPRGMTKEKLHADIWLKDIAPSTPLRKWFNHDPVKWKEFRKRYFRELDEKKAMINELTGKSNKGRLTLLYSAKDSKHNQAVALKEYLQNKFGKQE